VSDFRRSRRGATCAIGDGSSSRSSAGTRHESDSFIACSSMSRAFARSVSCALLEPFGQIVVLTFERDELFGDRGHLDRGDEIALLERLTRYANAPRVARAARRAVLAENAVRIKAPRPTAPSGCWRGR